MKTGFSYSTESLRMSVCGGHPVMEAPIYHCETGMTGNCRGRAGLFGRIVMQVEVVVQRQQWWRDFGAPYTKWRDVKPDDLYQRRVFTLEPT